MHSPRLDYCEIGSIWNWERNSKTNLFYLKSRKQYVNINNTYSDYNEIISGVPQSSILEPFLFNLSINDLFFFIETASTHNFADDDTLSAWGETLSKLIGTLESESDIATQTNSSPLFLIKRNLILQTFRWLLIIKLSSEFHQ